MHALGADIQTKNDARNFSFSPTMRFDIIFNPWKFGSLISFYRKMRSVGAISDRSFKLISHVQTS